MTWQDRYQHSLMNTFGTPKREFVRGEGVYVYDDQGQRYLDLLGGIAVNCLGHAHPQFLSALADQLGTVTHVSNFFATPTQIELAERLTGLVGHDSRVFLTNSGTEANEAAFKLTRRTGRTRLVAAEGAFHGRTVGALTITHNPTYRAPFEPLAGEVTFVPYGDEAALAAAVDDTVAAVVLEPIQGENGIIVPPDGYLAAARRITADAGALLWLDEIQTGMGRTGDWFAHTREGIVPDIITLAKSLGNGFPIGACIAVGDAATLLGPGSHGSTFGGNPLAARAALTVLDLVEPLLPQVAETGEWLAAELSRVPGVDHVRGRGLLRGVVLDEPIGPAVFAAALDAGFVVNSPRPHVIRLAPPLVITRDELRPFVGALG
ncbi:MAG TPA: acetylornithine transaminase, partial [Propionibacteriaceae bacterium]|nr:acetylornithine transaminase [Propionibacteriaceae bacterium]